MYGFHRDAAGRWFDFRWAAVAGTLGLFATSLFLLAGYLIQRVETTSKSAYRPVSESAVRVPVGTHMTEYPGEPMKEREWLHEECRSLSATDATMVNLAMICFKQGEIDTARKVAHAAHRVDNVPESFVLHHITHHFLWGEQPDVDVAVQVANSIEDGLTKARALTDIANYQAAQKDDRWISTTGDAVAAALKAPTQAVAEPRYAGNAAATTSPWHSWLAGTLVLAGSIFCFVCGGIAKPILEAVGKALLVGLTRQLPVNNV